MDNDIVARRRWDEDINTLNVVLKQWAGDYEYVGLYNDTVEGLNAILIRPLELMDREFEVTRTYLVEVTVTVTADNEDHAVALVEDMDEPDFTVDSTFDLGEVSVYSRWEAEPA